MNTRHIVVDTELGPITVIAEDEAITGLYGHGSLFTTRDRPVQSTRGWSAAPVRHGVSVIRSGQRHTLALVFHDAA